MKIGKRSTLEEFTPETFDAFAKEIGVGAPYVVRTARAVAGIAREAASTVFEEIAASGFQTLLLQELVEIVRARADRVLKLTTKPQAPGG